MMLAVISDYKSSLKDYTEWINQAAVNLHAWNKFNLKPMVGWSQIFRGLLYSQKRNIYTQTNCGKAILI